MKKDIKIGLIGFGAMGKVHAYCVDNLKYFYSPLGFSAKVLGVCCGHYENALKACNTFGFEKAYKNEDELIAAGVPSDLIRLSCGIENYNDLISDIANALAEI